jgi:hypothetical protein
MIILLLINLVVTKEIVLAVVVNIVNLVILKKFPFFLILLRQIKFSLITVIKVLIF